MHIFGPRDRYPPSPTRTYTPVPASLEAYRSLAGDLGIQRVVVVQPSAYGADNSCTLDAAAELGIAARAVVGIDDATSDADLDAMHRRGARGVRLNPESRGLRDVGEIGDLAEATAARIAPLGWHLQIFTGLPVIQALAKRFAAMPVPLVLDHMALAQSARGPDQPGFDVVCELLSSGRSWVKLSAPYRISSLEPNFEDAEPIIRALVDANPDRVVWGSDWPHTGAHGHAQSSEAPPITLRTIDVDRLLEQLARCVGNAETLGKILVDNAAELYGFND
jgi:predicted TIM-barrel fold metal-dependent hydrolase